MNELALFAGAGGSVLAAELLGWRCIAAVERDRYCRELLLRRQDEGHLEPCPIWDDVRTFDGRPFRGLVDIVTAGFPCQPFSVAGKQRGADDERNLWPDTVRVLREVRPRFAFLENVPGLLTSGYFDTVLGDLAEIGCNAEWCVLGADDCGAPHRRKRLWILAYSARDRRRGWSRQRIEPSSALWDAGPSAAVADADRRRCEGERCCRVLDGERKTYGDHTDGCSGRRSWWQHDPADEPGAFESGLGRVAYGVAHRVDRLRAIGNGWVPQVAATAFKLLMQRIGD